VFRETSTAFPGLPAGKAAPTFLKYPGIKMLARPQAPVSLFRLELDQDPSPNVAAADNFLIFPVPGS